MTPAPVLNLANALTFARLTLVVPVCAFLLVGRDEPGYLAAALVVAGGSAVLDKLDGYVARRLKQETDFGRLWDPVVDKLWLYAILLTLLKLQEASYWATGLFLSRDLVVSALRESSLAGGSILPAAYVGKLKFRFQAAYAISCIASLVTGQAFPGLTIPVRVIETACLWLAALFTIVSWVMYLNMFRTRT